MQLGSGQRRAFPRTLLAALLALAATAPAAGAAAVTGGAGMSSPSASSLAKAPAAAPVPVLSPVHGLPQLAAGVALRKVSAHAISAATLRYVSQAGGPLLVRVDVVRLADGLSIFHDERTAAPGAAQTIRWSGRARGGVALDGRYELRIATGAAGLQSMSAASEMGGAAPQASPPPPGSVSVSRFTFVGAVFPVRGRHSFGDAANRFGAGRDGHIHQGQDVLAKCGTPIVAAVGGVVRQRAVQSAAGNYVVIDDPITGQSYLYAHLRVPALVGHGAQVAAGQQIGVVGETGDATTCHLHFEIWTAPGWYLGGEPIDPLPTLRRWDRLG